MSSRADYLLVFLGLPASQFFTDQIRVMKGMFLLSQEGPQVLRNLYSFEAYDYGPFDTSVYHDLDTLMNNGLIEVEAVPGTNRRVYKMTARGDTEASNVIQTLPRDVLGALQETKRLVTSMSFTKLLEYVYARYPAYASRSLYRQ